MKTHPNIAVLGAGLAGLTLAWELEALGAQVTVYERDALPGGIIRTETRDGFVMEHGAQLAADRGELSRLALALGVSLVPAAESAKRRYVVRGGELVALDQNPLSIVRSKVLSTRGKLRALAEPLIPARDPMLGPESVAAFVRRRLGDEVLSWGIEPFVGGTLLGDVEALDVAYSMPGLAKMEREHGSLLRGGMSAPPGAPMRMVTVAGGMQRLVEALAASLGGLITNAQVVGVKRDDADLVVSWRDVEAREHTSRHDAVCSTLPGHALSPEGWPAQLRDALAACGHVRYTPVTIVALGYRRDQVSHPLDGLGALVPGVEGRQILAALFSSSVTPAHAPEDHVLITVMLGGARQAALAELPAEAAIHIAREELASLLGVRGEPVIVSSSRRKWALPQPELGFERTRAAIALAEQQCKGIYLGGSITDGAGIPTTLQRARSRAQEIVANLSLAT